MSKKVFILEDDPHIQELLRYNLANNGYITKSFFDSDSILSDTELDTADLFLLDIMLPGGSDGYQVCRKLKESDKTSSIPIIFLSAKSEEFDTVLGLELGAEDYIKKPFGINELLSRVKVAIRRNDKKVSTSQQSGIISINSLSIDLDKHMVFKNDKEINLTLKEYDLLKILMENPCKVLSRDYLLENVWGFEYLGETRTVDVHVRYLRQKIEDDDSNPKYLLTVRGVGYKFDDK